MNQRGFPLWLLRDVRTLVAVMLSFWPLVIFVITNGPKAVRGAAGPRNTISLLLAHAEAWLDYAFMRQAYRLCGFGPRAVTLHIIPPTTRWADTVERFRNYGLAFRNMNRVVASHVEALRERYAISKRDLAANGASAPRIHHAPHSPFNAPKSSLAVRRGRWRALARDGGGCHYARGPPQRIHIPESAPRRRPASENARACAKRKGRLGIAAEPAAPP